MNGRAKLTVVKNSGNQESTKESNVVSIADYKVERTARKSQVIVLFSSPSVA